MREHKTLILLGSILLAASLLVAFTPIASTAFAASTGPTSASELTPRSPQTIRSITAGAGSPQQLRITCYASVSLPFVAGNDMEAIGSIYCTARVSALAVTTFLNRDGRLVAKNTSLKAGKNYDVNRVTYKCTYPYHYHNWQVAMVGVVYFPPRYRPPSGTLASVSGIVNLLC
jgi:hypothetical protein